MFSLMLAMCVFGIGNCVFACVFAPVYLATQVFWLLGLDNLEYVKW